MKNGYYYYLEIQKGEEFPFVGWSERTISEEALRPNKGAEKVYIVKEVQKPPPKDRKVNRSRSAFINPVRYEKFSLHHPFLLFHVRVLSLDLNNDALGQKCRC